MVVKNTRDKNQIKIVSLSEGKGIIIDVIAVLKEAEIDFKEALDLGDKLILKTIPSRIKITLK